MGSRRQPHGGINAFEAKHGVLIANPPPVLAVPPVTERDLANQAPKAEANKVLVNGSEAQKLELLKYKPGALQGLFAIRSKADYEALELLLIQS